LKPIKQHIEKANNEMGRAEKQQEITNLQSTLYNVCQSIWETRPSAKTVSGNS